MFLFTGVLFSRETFPMQNNKRGNEEGVRKRKKNHKNVLKINKKKKNNKDCKKQTMKKERKREREK